MSDRKKHRTANEYLQYLKGDLSNQERHSIERELEADPFEMEAMEGLKMLTTDQAEVDILTLHTRLRKRLRRKRKIAWYSAAASIASLLIIGTVFLRIYDLNPEIAQEPLNEGVYAPAQSESTEGVVPDKTITEEGSEEPAKDLSKGPEEGPVEDPAESAADAAEIQTTETPLTVTRDAKAPISEAPEATVPTPEAKAEAVYLEEDILKKEAGRKASRRSDRLSQPAVARPEAMQKKALSQEESAQIDTPQLYEVVALDQGIQPMTVSAEDYSETKMDEKENGRSTPARPAEGFKEFKQYIEENIQFPDVETTASRVTVILRFTVKPSGEISDIIALRSPGQPFTQEATRLIMDGPSWNPASDENGHIEEIIRIRIVFKK